MLHENRHNETRDKAANEYHTLRSLECRFCGRVVPLPSCHEIKTEFRYEDTLASVIFRADVAAVDSDGNIVAVIEVIDSHEPRAEVFEAQARLSEAFYITPDAFADGAFSGWCNGECWRRRAEEHVCEVPRRDDCDTILPGSEDFSLGYGNFGDWNDDPHYRYCLRCAAARPGYPQWWPPMGDYVADRNGVLPHIPGNAVCIFLAWNSANFWAMVWGERAKQPGETSLDEVATAQRLDVIEFDFDKGDWAKGAKLLWPIGNRYMQGDLWAWDPGNCKRVALAWHRLCEYLLNALPSDIKTIIKNRPVCDEEDELQQDDAPHEESAWEAAERQWAENPEEARARLIHSVSSPDDELN